MNKVTIDKDMFLSKLIKIMKFVPTTAVIPMYESLLLSIVDNVMEVVATDSNIQIKMKCRVESTCDFAMCVPAKWLFHNINLYRENSVVIVMKEIQKEDRVLHQIDMKCGKSKSNIISDCLPEQYSIMPMQAATNEITLKQFFLRMGLKSAESFVDEKSPNANYTSVNISEVDNKIVFMGLSLAVMCRAAVQPISINKWEPIPIHSETAKRVASLLEDKGEICVVHDGEKIRFFTDNEAADVFTVTACAATNKILPAEKLFATRPENKYIINTLEFKDAIKRLKPYHEAGSVPAAHLSIADGELAMTASDNLSGRHGEESMSIVNPEGHVIDKDYGIEYFLDILAHVESQEFVFYFNDNKRQPSLLVPKVNSPEEDIYAFLIANQGSASKK